MDEMDGVSCILQMSAMQSNEYVGASVVDAMTTMACSRSLDT